MNPTATLADFYANVIQEAVIGSSHISLYMALYQLWSRNNWCSPIFVKRKEVMVLAKIGSSATYHKCLKQLVETGCIQYEPCPNPKRKSKIYLIKRDRPEKDSGNAGAQP